MNGPLQSNFYARSNVGAIARELLGMVIVTAFDGNRTTGMITETEAYAGVDDRASHAYGGRRTSRTEPMYAEGGTIYVYRCYGIHHLFNVVTAARGTPHAVLIRGIHPLEGRSIMQQRRGQTELTTAGPGNLTVAMGITVAHSGTDLFTGPVRVEDHAHRIRDEHVIVGPRIGVGYAGPDAELPYRYRIAPSHLSTIAVR